jgi:cysteine protease ATG4
VLDTKQSVGILGGQHNLAYYYIGYIGDSLLYLDPHTSQSYVDLRDPSVSEEVQCHSVALC